MATALKNIAGFQQTKEMTQITFGGWDGKSYDGEGQNLRVWINPEYPGKKFVKKNFRGRTYEGKNYTVACFHVLTGIPHAKSGIEEVELFCDVPSTSTRNK